MLASFLQVPSTLKPDEPKIRKALHLREGSKLDVSRKNGAITLRPLSSDPIEESFGCLAGKPGEPSLVDILLAERKAEMEREDGRF